MSWVKLDDRFTEHRKVASLSDGAFRSHLEAMCFVARSLTDGKIASRVAAKIGHADELEAAGLWDRVRGGYEIHDYLEYNPTAERVEATKEERAKAGKKGGKRSAEVRWGKQKDKQNAEQPGKQNCNPVPVPPPLPVPLVSNPSDSHPASAGAGFDWFVNFWNQNVAPHLPACRTFGDDRSRALAGMLRAANGDRDHVLRSAAAFADWDFAREKSLGVDTFLRAKNRSKHLEWGVAGCPANNGEAVQKGEIAEYFKGRFNNFGEK